MAEDWNKYKWILEREDKEFREAMKADVGTYGFPNLVEKGRIPAEHILSPTLWWILQFFSSNT